MKVRVVKREEGERIVPGVVSLTYRPGTPRRHLYYRWQEGGRDRILHLAIDGGWQISADLEEIENG